MKIIKTFSISQKKFYEMLFLENIFKTKFFYDKFNRVFKKYLKICELFS